MQISLESNIKKISASLDMFQRTQLPFAISSSLNKTSIAAQNSIISAIPHIFNNRKKWWGKNQPTGIKVKFSSKYELVSAIYTKAYFAHIQEQGGIKKPYRGMNIAIPADNLPKRLRKSNALVKEQGNGRIFKSRSGKAIMQRTGGKVGSRSVRRLYTLVPQANIRPRFCFKQMACKAFNRKFDAIFNKQLAHAVKTAF